MKRREKNMASKNKPNEIYLTRIFDAPVKTVWEAWTDPKQVVHWFGPRGYSITTHSMDTRTGGSWSYTMVGPDGTKWENKTKYLEVQKYSRMVYDHGGHDDRPPVFRVTVDFTEISGKTLMEMTMALPTAEAAAETKKFIKKAGGDSTWDRLAEFVTASSGDQFVINRSFDVSVEKMFDLWANPNHLAKWMGPTGSTMEFLQAEVKIGGTSFYHMVAEGGVQMYGKIHYLEIEKPHRLVYTQIFCDQDGKISRHPMAPTWPETMLTQVTFTEESPTRTRVTINWQVHGHATAEERATFHNAKAGMAQGWGGSFDKLEAYIQQ
jgi:uncharacterized protein YndB with AHSA1/START domain